MIKVCYAGKEWTVVNNVPQAFQWSREIIGKDVHVLIPKKFPALLSARESDGGQRMMAHVLYLPLEQLQELIDNADRNLE